VDEVAPAAALLADAAARGDLIIALTGAGISAESGIPTFRGKEGYWTDGSREYHPQELATREAFGRLPDTIWAWYLYRRTVCRRAEPNEAHRALADADAALGDRFLLITQNVDGLHLRAGSPLERTFQVHGNIDFMRCGADCGPDVWPIPELIGALDRGDALPDAWKQALCCLRCGEGARPHVLWFDEFYDEERFRFESSLAAARRAAVVISVGTTATTNLPWHVVETAVRAGAALIDVNPDDNPFADLARRHPRGAHVRANAAAALPRLARALCAP
jgi:NAD-dependent deacetylase